MGQECKLVTASTKVILNKVSHICDTVEDIFDPVVKLVHKARTEFSKVGILKGSWKGKTKAVRSQRKYKEQYLIYMLNPMFKSEVQETSNLFPSLQ